MKQPSDQSQTSHSSSSPQVRDGEGLNKQILRIAIPSIVTNITVPLLGMFDLAIAGHIGSASIIGAISVGGLIFNMVYWLFNFLRMGTSGVTAQAFGRRDAEAMRDALRMSLSVAFAFGLLIFFLQRPIEWFAHLLIQPTDEVWQLAIDYFRIRIWAAPAVLAIFALNGWFTGMQNTHYPMCVAIGQNVLNILSSAAFVFIWHMGIEGVALGTVISQYAGLVAFLVKCPKLCPAPLLSSWSGEGIDDQGLWSKFRHTFQSSTLWGDMKGAYRDIFLRMICLIAVTTAFTSLGARQGDMLLAVNTLLIQLFILFSYFCDGFSLAGEALVGRFVGALSDSAKQRCVRLLFLWAGAVVLLFTLLYWLGGNLFLLLFTDQQEVIQASQPYLPWVLSIPVCGFAAFMWDGIFTGATATRQMLYSLIVGTIVFFGVWILPLPLPVNHHLWLAFILYLTARSLWTTMVAPRVLNVRQ